MRFSVTPVARGEAQVVAWHRKGVVEVLYRSRDPSRVETVLRAVQAGFDRGVKESHRGWPFEVTERQLFGLLDDAGANKRLDRTPQDPTETTVVEHHPRMASWDVPLYRTQSRADAEMVLRAVRRAASIGCLWSASLNTLGKLHGYH